MKNKIGFTIIIILLALVQAQSQTLKLGIAGNIMISNKYLDYQLGPSVLAEYFFDNIPLSLKSELRYSLSDVSDYKSLSYNYSLNTFSFGVSANYYPIEWAIEPYVGFGLFFESNNLSKEGNPFTYEDGTLRYLDSDDNSFAPEAKLGIRFSAKSKLNFFIEMTKTFSGTVHYQIYDAAAKMLLNQEDINLNNSLSVRLGLIFSI
jgi:hypothetical protein